MSYECTSCVRVHTHYQEHVETAQALARHPNQEKDKATMAEQADEVSPSHVVTLNVMVCVLSYVRNGKSMFNIACRELAIA